MKGTDARSSALLPTLTGVTLLGIGIAGIHAYWGIGGHWPGKDPITLGRKVFASETQQLPPPAACFAVTGALTFTTAALTLSGRPGPLQAASQRVCQLAAGILLTRGLLGFVLPRFTQANPEFRHLNRTIYSPLCIGLGGALLAVQQPCWGDNH